MQNVCNTVLSEDIIIRDAENIEWQLKQQKTNNMCKERIV